MIRRLVCRVFGHTWFPEFAHNRSLVWEWRCWDCGKEVTTEAFRSPK